MSGRVGDLSPAQEKILSEFKARVKDVHKPDYDDYYYLRWLRARNFDKEKTEAMLRKNLSWRADIGADTILTDYKPPEVLDKFYPRSFLGADKEGCPVRYLPFKNLDYRGFSLSIARAETVKFLTYLYEEETEFMRKQTIKLGRKIENSTYILDIDGYTFKQATNRQSLDTLNTLIRVFEQNYPERLKVAYFIKVPYYFSMILSLSKPFLSEATLNKFKIFGHDNYKEFLLSVIDEDVLPACLGGKRTDPDGNPLCYSIINYGSFVPKSYYYSHREDKFPSEEGVRTLVLQRRSSEMIEVEVSEAGSRLDWEVETLDYDIGVGLYYWRSKAVGDPELEELLPVERISSHLVPESCSHLCERVGIYAVKFDNTYSWFSQKKIMYRITVTRPENIESALTPV